MKVVAVTGFSLAMLLLITPGQFDTHAAGQGTNGQWVALTRGTANDDAAYVCSSLHSERNTMGTFFEWTNAGSSPSSMRSLLVLATNSIR